MNKMHSALPWAVAVSLTIVMLAGVNRWMSAIASEPTITPVARRYFELNNKAAVLRNKLRSMVIDDSVKALLPAKPSFFVGALDHNPDRLDELRTLGARELRDTSKATVGVVVTPLFWLHLDGFPDFGDSHAFFSGTKAGTPYCVTSIDAYDAKSGYEDWEKPDGKVHRRFSGYRRHAILGACPFYGRYGAPGDSVARWLTASNARFYSFDPIEFEFNRSRREQVLLQFGRGYIDVPITARACAAHRLDECANAFVAVPDQSKRSWLGDMWGGGALPSQHAVLSRLELEFGEERFGRFWTSDADVPTAFASAFGVTVGEWVYRQTNQLRGYVRATPRMSLQTVLLTLVLVSLVLALTLSTTNRRVI
ncbi:MAG TPA: hypothetical protein VM100_10385 [Longimicrobiales bacterium]|nr:hypothetical protein [Longimicrobiales bacterium]